MMSFKNRKWSLLILAIAGVVAIIGCAAPDVDVTAPTVESTAPAASAVDVLIDTVVTATFDEDMDAATIVADNFTLAAGVTDVAGVVSYDVASKTATFTPDVNLVNATEYTATIGVGVLDVAGNALASPHTWSFTTGALGDTTPPTVTLTVPADTDTDVAVNENITATFSEAMASATVIAAGNFTLAAGLTPVAGGVTYDAVTKTATFDPDAALTYSVEYTASISTAVTDAAGNALEAVEVWTFTTEAGVPLGPDPVLLGSAGDYVILAETTVTNTLGFSDITGDIGLSPGFSAALAGFALVAGGTSATSSDVTGLLYAADMTEPTPTNLGLAIGDKLIAYNDAAARASTDPELSPTEYFLDFNSGNLGGQTLAPGLYEFTTAITIPGNVTFSGGPNDVWILQTPGTLSISANMDVILAGFAVPGNIFWQVTTIATLGAGAQFQGIILAGTDIVMETGASLVGRALSATQVTLDSVTVVGP